MKIEKDYFIENEGFTEILYIVLDRRMRLSTAKRLQKELAYCQNLLHNPTNNGENYV